LAVAEQAASLAALKREGGPEGQRVVVQADGSSGADDLAAAGIALRSLRGVGGAEGAAAELVVTRGEKRLSQLMAQVGLGSTGLIKGKERDLRQSVRSLVFQA
jgi:phosphosulfolactate phosphohydrolase-like enzyme